MSMLFKVSYTYGGTLKPRALLIAGSREGAIKRVKARLKKDCGPIMYSLYKGFKARIVRDIYFSADD